MKVWVGRRAAASIARHTAEGNGPVNALDAALRAAVGARYPQLDHVHLTDYKVRILDGAADTGAVTRVLIDSTDGERVVDARSACRRTSSRRRGRRCPTRSSSACSTPDATVATE